jgi:hypothetical protein
MASNFPLYSESVLTTLKSMVGTFWWDEVHGWEASPCRGPTQHSGWKKPTSYFILACLCLPQHLGCLIDLAQWPPWPALLNRGLSGWLACLFILPKWSVSLAPLSSSPTLTGLPAPALGLPNQPGSVTSLACLTWPGTVWLAGLPVRSA